jgi:branched-chain amino acid transport system substrate-binding protein
LRGVRATRACLAGAALAVALVARASGAGSSGAIEPLPQSFCSRLVAGGNGTPTLLIVSDLPLAGTGPAPRMADAIRYTLARHLFKAGKYRVAYQSCDDSNPQTQEGDLGRCVANARAYAANSAVIGVVGTWSSRCSAFELPILNGARPGPLVLVSPSNTNVGLTRSGPGAEAGEPGRYYPTGRRSFVRVIAHDNVQGAAEALLASRLRLKRVFVLDDGEAYGVGVADAFTRAARRLGLRIAGSAPWSPAGTSFGAVAARVGRARPDAVFLGGFACPACGALIKQIRVRAGKKSVLLAPDGFYPLTAVHKAAGAAAEGMYASAAGTTVKKLNAAGRMIARRYGPPLPVAGGAPYAAEAAEVLLAAIARSNGTRASVNAHVRSTSVRGGILGTFRFDRDGDITAPDILIFRLRHGRQVVDRVIVPPASLTR